MGGTGVFLCTCGKTVNLNFRRMKKEFGKAEDVRVVEVVDILCGKEGIPYITQHLRWKDDRKLDRVVIGACSRKNALFEKVGNSHGIGEDALDIVNIRELCGWVHADKKAATEKALAMLKWQLEAPKYMPELVEIPSDPGVLVVGGVNGVRLAEELAKLGANARVLPDGGYLKKDCGFCVSSELCSPHDRDCLYQVEGEGIYTNYVLAGIEGDKGDLEVKLERGRAIDMEACMECGKCIEACPKKAISSPEDAVSKIYLLNEKCDECGACVEACPVDAVALETREEALKVGQVISLIDMPSHSGVYVCADGNPLEAYERGQAAAIRAVQFLKKTEKEKLLETASELCANHRLAEKTLDVTGCTLCSEACVYDAIESGVIDHSACVECGACIGACPQGVIRWVDHPQGDLLKEIEALLEAKIKPKVLMLSCMECGYETTYQAGARREKYPPVMSLFVPCLGSVADTTILRALDLGADGVLLSGCAGGKCAHEKGFKGAGKTVRFVREALRTFAMEDGRVGQIQSNPEKPGQFATSVKKFVADIEKLKAPSLKKKSPVQLEGLDVRDSRREMLIALLQGYSQKSGVEEGVIKGDYPFGDVMVDAEKCTLCGACANLCSTGAMESEGSDLNEEGWIPKITFTHSYCTGCGICEQICPEKAIGIEQVLDLKRFINREQAELKVELTKCEDCGMPIMAQTAYNKLSKHLVEKEQSLPKLCRDCRDKVTVADLLGLEKGTFTVHEHGKRVI
ncbi:MAG: 4Fe-4S binding protein [Candidatus Hydrothermarchaeaceae archaeon]